jgi:peroxiredoxin
MPRFNNGEAFPTLTLDTVGKGALSVTGHLAGSYGVVLMYRGSWCPYCSAQLSAFARAQEKPDDLRIRIVALSVDNRAEAAALVEKHRLNFPVGYGVDAGKIAASTCRCLRQRQPALPAIHRLCARPRWKGYHRRLLQRRDRQTGCRRCDRLHPVREVKSLAAFPTMED